MVKKIIRKCKRGVKKIKRKLKGIRAKFRWAKKNSYYVKLLQKAPLDEYAVLLESKSGKDVAGNIFYLLKELTSGAYPQFKVYLHVSGRMVGRFRRLFERYGIEGVEFVRTGSMDYRRLLATAKYLFNDTTFPAWFIKREGQVYLNTWHGTPFKMMGRDVWNRAYAIGNVQRNFLISDYLLYPNDYMKEKMMNAYMLHNTWKGKALLEGYPRNSVFFDNEERGRELKEELGIADKKMIVYMPTWRGVLTNKKTDAQMHAAYCYFHVLDHYLQDDEIIYVKFHLFTAKKFKFGAFKHIKPLPARYETYDLLNAADVLITDYSSVFYDFANSGKKIVLFTYDRESYLDERGLYVPIDSFPFPQANHYDELLAEIRSPKNYDDTEFRAKYCKYDNKDAARRILDHVLLGKNCCKEEKPVSNGKENVLVYCSNLGRNGMTTSLLNLINLVDKEKANYYFTFPQDQLAKVPGRLSCVPETVDLLPMSGSITEKTLAEVIAFKLYFKFNLENRWIERKMRELFTREYDKKFGAASIDKIIHFTGYAPYVTMMFLQADAKKAIFVHNDMYDEIQEKGNQHLLTLKHAYREYDRVVPVSQATKDSLLKIETNQDNVVIVENAHFDEGVREKATQEFAVDKETKITMNKEAFAELLQDKSRKKFITIGRFSEEKGHKKLIEAFAEFAKTHEDVVLIIIGGYGVLYGETVKFAAAQECADRIVIVRAISNPFTILRECDLFLLPSNREPLGLVLLEADTLGIPIVATDIPGSGDFLRRYNGHLVENSVAGLVGGMEAFWRGEVKALNISFKDYNQKIVNDFEHLFDEKQAGKE
ncbi:MAG: CDP-glycerol glycerophosphotransferase family protein [Lachnospiraceae bacterium]|nr:CDP-glycerol glycerophosphotransferase family protein [Lachnospiraceae bacterium]